MMYSEGKLDDPEHGTPAEQVLMLAAQEIRPLVSRWETGCKYTASQEPLKCENWILSPKGRTMSLGLDLWHISFLPNQYLCAGRLHSEPRPVPLRNRVWAPHHHPSCPALSEGWLPLVSRGQSKAPLVPTLRCHWGWVTTTECASTISSPLTCPPQYVVPVYSSGLKLSH